MNTPRQASRVVCALLMACGLALVGCSSTPTAAEPPATIGRGSDVAGDFEDVPVVGELDGSADDADRIDTVMMVGDSITVGATPALESQFDALGLDHDIEAEGGKRMVVSSSGNPGGASVTESMVGADERDPASEVWVIALGTNDIGQYASPDEIAAAVNELLAEVPDDSALVWVDAYVRDREEQSEDINTIVRDRVARRGNSVIAPWSANATADGVLSSDGVHPTTDGSVWFAHVVTDTVRSFLER